MDITSAIEMCKLEVRRNTFLGESDWKLLLNRSQMELQRSTHFLKGDFYIQMESGVRLYDLAGARCYSILEDMTLSDGSAVQRKARDEMSGYTLTDEGTPSMVYPAGGSVVGLYSVPDDDYDQQRLSGYGKLFPAPITHSTENSTELAFPEMFHDIVVLGAVMQAERIDSDVVVSDRVRQQYQDGILSMRAAAAGAMPGTTVIRTNGR